MNRINFCLEFDNLTDSQLLVEMLTNDMAHSCVYQRHKKYCINYMLSKGAAEKDVLDIYQDATIVLYEKIQNPEFRLTCSIQTYLNSVCYYQFLARTNSVYAKNVLLTDDVDEYSQDWFSEDTENIDLKIEKLLEEFEKLKINGTKCYERLRLFYYDKCSMAEIAIKQGLTDANNAKQQINRCRNLLKNILGV